MDVIFLSAPMGFVKSITQPKGAKMLAFPCENENFAQIPTVKCQSKLAGYAKRIGSALKGEKRAYQKRNVVEFAELMVANTRSTRAECVQTIIKLPRETQILCFINERQTDLVQYQITATKWFTTTVKHGQNIASSWKVIWADLCSSMKRYITKMATDWTTELKIWNSGHLRNLTGSELKIRLNGQEKFLLSTLKA